MTDLPQEGACRCREVVHRLVEDALTRYDALRFALQPGLEDRTARVRVWKARAWSA